jgi:hypothetical protein
MITVKTPAQGLEQYNVKVTPMLENRIMNDLELGDLEDLAEQMDNIDDIND